MMYRTCVVHAPVPCTVMDEIGNPFLVTHDRDLKDWEIEVLTYATDQENAYRPEDERD